MEPYLWLLPAVVCGLVALVGNIVLGAQVIKRQIIFIDLAVAQIAALGAVLSHYYFSQYHFLSGSFIGEMTGPWLLSLLLCALIGMMEKHYQHHLEAMIGSLFVVSASVAILVVSKDPHGADFIQGVLNGQLLWATWDDVVPLAVITALVLVLVWLRPSVMHGHGFYIIFAVLMPITVKMTGVYLEFALLVIPALCASALKGKRFLLTSISIGMLGILSGILLSAVYDLPSGASIVVCLFTIGVVFNLGFLPFISRGERVKARG
ncbi:metal ABC transporter permease [Vibrio sp. WXL103]|uniref:metal ABC transporter permease n=1 Tax=unclassified Vibrio TaxID=2614977 RepID=UPI003EC5751B